MPQVEPFAPDLLPEALRAYVLDVADRQQSPPDFAAVAALCGLAAVVGNKARIRPKQHDDWMVVPNLWGAIVGRPSAMKSPAMQSALGPVYGLQDEMRELWQQRCASLAVDEALAGLDAADAKSKAKKALKVGDRDAAKEIMAGAMGSSDEGEPCPRLIIGDATFEKVGELLSENSNGLLLVRDELPGFLARLESAEFQNERAFYLESFNGDGSFVFDRIARGTISIPICTISLVGGVQPSRIAPLVRGAISGTSNDGLLQRLQLSVWPDDIPSWRWVDRAPDPLARVAYERAFRDLRDLPAQADGEPLVLRFSPPAQTAFREWMEETQSEARSGALPSTMESHILKMPKTVASLALLFQLIDGHSETVGEEATLRALDWADYLRSHANRLYAAGQTMAEEGAKLIIERRSQIPAQFTPRDIQRKAWGGLADRDAVASALEMLVASHHCREIPASGGNGRPSTSYVWNPALTVEG
ncbi:YfjI family protein [Bosea sp. PAMC 26642]|uniref:YfjI family protein n=1 Tax=Bosea sp. (strain PAMC 26642) TaxID=1792307 RepID=UPI001F350601|nr:YfjI family protein [Bosea sp. PAMC 26642]